MALSDNRTTDKTKPLAEFSKRLAAMDRDAKALSNEAESANRDADAYFRAWNREAMNDPNKQANQPNVAVRKQNYATAQSYLESARRHYIEFTENLHGIERMYSQPGTNSSQPAVRAALDKAGMDAAYVKEYISRLGEQIDAALRAQ